MTATQNSDGGGGTLGGTASSICAISPSDLVGTVGNIITRLEAIEQAIVSVLGANLHTESLDNLSQQVGWVYGVEYMGVPGWTQTEYGTLIPPAGFTMSGSGIQMWNSCTGEFQDFQAVVMDDQGVLQWGADSIGNLCGSKVEAWDAAAAGDATQDYAIVWTGNSGAGSSLRNVSVVSSSTTQISLQVTNAGLYHVDAKAALVTSGADTGMDVVISITKSGTPGSSDNGLYSHYSAYGNSALWHASPTASGIIALAAGENIQAYISTAGGPYTTEILQFHIVRVSA